AKAIGRIACRLAGESKQEVGKRISRPETTETNCFSYIRTGEEQDPAYIRTDAHSVRRSCIAQAAGNFTGCARSFLIASVTDRAESGDCDHGMPKIFRV